MLQGLIGFSRIRIHKYTSRSLSELRSTYVLELDCLAHPLTHNCLLPMHSLTLQSSCRRSRTAAAPSLSSFHRRAQSEGPVNRAATSAAAASTAATAHRVRRVDHDEIRPKSTAAAPLSSQRGRAGGRKVSTLNKCMQQSRSRAIVTFKESVNLYICCMYLWQV